MEHMNSATSEADLIDVLHANWQAFQMGAEILFKVRHWLDYDSQASSEAKTHALGNAILLADAGGLLAEQSRFVYNRHEERTAIITRGMQQAGYPEQQTQKLLDYLKPDVIAVIREGKHIPADASERYKRNKGIINMRTLLINALELG